MEIMEPSQRELAVPVPRAHQDQEDLKETREKMAEMASLEETASMEGMESTSPLHLQEQMPVRNAHQDLPDLRECRDPKDLEEHQVRVFMSENV